MQSEPRTQTDSHEQVRQILYRAIDEVNALGGAPIEKSPDTVLVGDAGRLDSFSFVNFVMAVEQNTERAFPGRSFSLIDAISAREEPDLTIEALTQAMGDHLGANA
jgi:acyl carrier protein